MIRAICALLALTLFPVATSAATAPADKPRVIAITDIGNEPDDSMSMVRLLTYANDLDIEGLIATTSIHLPDQVGPHLIRERIAKYAEVLGNLRVHDPAYPASEALLARVRAVPPVYGMAGVGKGKDNEASRLIVAAADSSDPRPVWVSIWGGAQPLAQALWSVRATRSPAQLARFVSKLRVYSISDQDDAGPWARINFPQLFWIASIHGPQQYRLATWTGISGDTPGADPAPVSRQWLARNIRSKGPLGTVYPPVAFIMEGDTPSFLYVIPNGLGSTEHPDWGSWGGRYARVSAYGGLWSDVADTVIGVDGKPVGTRQATIWRWRSAFQNDFAARMAWSVTPAYKDANHAAELVLNGRAGLAPVEITACPGEPVTLSSAGSRDPDKQRLKLRWWSYRDINGLYEPPSVLSAAEGEATVFTAPPWTHPPVDRPPASVRFHVILEATDSGAPALTRYRRAIVTVPLGAGRSASGTVCAPIKLTRPPRLAATTARAYVAPTSPYNTADTSIRDLADNPAARAIVERHVPGFIAMAAESPAQGMTLRDLAPLAPVLTDAVLDAIEAELKTLP
jgi:hypothetical protein